MKQKKSGSKKTIMIVGISVIALAIIAAIFLRPSGESYGEETAKIQDITTYYSFTGNIEAKDSQSVFSTGMLPIKEFHVKEGDLVKKGDLLFVLDDDNVAANIAQAEASVEISKINYDKMQSTAKDQQLAQAADAVESARLTFIEAETNLTRSTELFDVGGTSTQALEQAQKGYDMAKLQLESAQKNYEVAEKTVDQNILTAREQLRQAEASLESVKKQIGDLEVTAEIDGEITEIYVEENDSLMTGTKIMDIVNYEDLEVTIRVDEFDIGAITVGKEVTVTITTLEKDLVGIVSKVSKQAQTMNGISFFTAHIDLEKDENLRVGLSTEVKSLNKSTTNATTISMKALQFDESNTVFVYHRDANGTVASKPVTVGINDGNWVEILDGVKSGEVVLIPLARNNVMQPPMNMPAAGQGR